MRWLNQLIGAVFKECPGCGIHNPWGARRCPKCGHIYRRNPIEGETHDNPSG